MRNLSGRRCGTAGYQRPQHDPEQVASRVPYAARTEPRRANACATPLWLHHVKRLVRHTLCLMTGDFITNQIWNSKNELWHGLFRLAEPV